jgi:hypothetical protein
MTTPPKPSPSPGNFSATPALPYLASPSSSSSSSSASSSASLAHSNTQHKRAHASYTFEQKIAAIEDVESALKSSSTQKVALEAVSGRLHVPISTLTDWYNLRERIHALASTASMRKRRAAHGGGRPAVVAEEVEQEIEEEILKLRKDLYLVPPRLGKAIASRVLEDYGLGEEVKVSQSWWQGFCARHKLGNYVAHPTTARKQLYLSVESQVADQRQGVIDFLARTFLTRCLQQLDTVQIVNADETALSLEPHRAKTMDRKGTRSAKYLTQGREKTTRTMLAIASAAGQLFAPILVLPDSKFEKGEASPDVLQLRLVGEQGAVEPVICHTPSGWMNSTLYSTIVDALKAWVGRDKLLLVHDEFSGHCSAEESDGFFISSIPAHLTGTMQPLDLCFFRSLKKELDRLWVDACLAGGRRWMTPTEAHEELARQVSSAYERMRQPDMRPQLVAAFESSGIVSEMPASFSLTVPADASRSHPVTGRDVQEAVANLLAEIRERYACPDAVSSCSDVRLMCSLQFYRRPHPCRVLAKRQKLSLPTILIRRPARATQRRQMTLTSTDACLFVFVLFPSCFLLAPL